MAQKWRPPRLRRGFGDSGATGGEKQRGCGDGQDLAPPRVPNTDPGGELGSSRPSLVTHPEQAWPRSVGRHLARYFLFLIVVVALFFSRRSPSCPRISRPPFPTRHKLNLNLKDSFRVVPATGAEVRDKQHGLPPALLGPQASVQSVTLLSAGPAVDWSIIASLTKRLIIMTRQVLRTRSRFTSSGVMRGTGDCLSTGLGTPLHAAFRARHIRTRRLLLVSTSWPAPSPKSSAGASTMTHPGTKS